MLAKVRTLPGTYFRMAITCSSLRASLLVFCRCVFVFRLRSLLLRLGLSKVLKKAKSPRRHRVTEKRKDQNQSEILILIVLIFLCVSVSLWLSLVFNQPLRG